MNEKLVVMYSATTNSATATSSAPQKLNPLCNPCDTSVPSATGSRNAANPNIWNNRSDVYAPTGPIQFRVRWSSPPVALTLNAASRGEYEISASPIKIAVTMHKNPVSSFRRLFSVGVKNRTILSSTVAHALLFILDGPVYPGQSRPAHLSKAENARYSSPRV